MVLFDFAYTVPERSAKEKRETRVSEDENMVNDSGHALAPKEWTW